MRYIRFAFLAILGVCLVAVALANRGEVVLRLVPGDLAEFSGVDPQVSLPLFLVIFGSIIAGILIGFFWEWMREHKHRAEAVVERRARQKLEHEVTQLRDDSGQQEDEVLALLENAAASR
ncbi:MAG: LapA family protein [Paracoccaceae bacterium]|nr:LapA family protein [Paracoccaceae bacterium]